MGLEQLLVRYGVAAVFVGAAIEGDFVLILSGVVAHLGYFPLAVAIGRARSAAWPAIASGTRSDGSRGRDSVPAGCTGGWPLVSSG